MSGKVVKSKGLNARLYYPARLSFKKEGEIRNSTEKED